MGRMDVWINIEINKVLSQHRRFREKGYNLWRFVTVRARIVSRNKLHSKIKGDERRNSIRETNSLVKVICSGEEGKQKKEWKT